MEIAKPHKHQKDIDEALQFALGIRGRYIIAQALNHGIRQLSKVPSLRREHSNINDMEYLRKTLFVFPPEIFEMSLEEGICVNCGGDDVTCEEDCTLHKCVNCDYIQETTLKEKN